MTQRETGEITSEYCLWQPKTIDAEQVYGLNIPLQRHELIKTGSLMLSLMISSEISQTRVVEVSWQMRWEWANH
jgi:hypothetical protein